MLNPAVRIMSMKDVVHPLVFSGHKVYAFGMPEIDWNIAKMFHILYYKDNDRFIIKITPKDSRQEIILAKGFNTSGPFEKTVENILTGIQDGRQQMKIAGNEKKYKLIYTDKIIIPELRFNLEKNYDNFIGTMVSDVYRIDTARQRTAFILDKFGAIIQSEAEVIAVLAALPQNLPNP